MKYRNHFVFKMVVLTTTVIIFVSCKSKAVSESTIDSSQINSDGVSVVDNADRVTITCIRDCENEMPVDLFKGSCCDTCLSRLAPNGSFKSAINVYLAMTDKYTVLFDAGLGNEKGGALLAKLAYLKVKPEKVNAIFLTHLHPDHIGGLLKDGKPVFPNAIIYLSVDEFNAWSDGGSMAAQNGLWKQVLASYALNIQPVNDGDKLLDGIVEAHLAPGHTPGHTIYTVGDCLIVGDLLHAQDLQLSHPECCARYDNDFEKSVKTRLKFYDFVRERNLYLCGAHCYDSKVTMTD